MTNNQPFTPYIIGIGPGDAAYIYPLAQQLIEQAEVLIGGRRNLAELARPGHETLVIDRGLAQVAKPPPGGAGQRRHQPVQRAGVSAKKTAGGAVWRVAGH